MNGKLNCWEYKECGREPDGLEIARHGVCPASTSTEAHGLNDGKNGGRICWSIAGTFINSKVTGKFASDKFSCINCDFFQLVSEEQELEDFDMLTPVQMVQFKKKTSQVCTQLIEKRSSERYDANLNVNFTCCNREYAGKVTNISETGMFISAKDISFPNDSRFEVQLNINNEYIHLPVRMCRLTISPDLHDGMGVEILNPPQNYLIQYDKLRSFAMAQIQHHTKFI